MGVGTTYEDGDAGRLFLIAFQELAKTYATRNLVEEYVGAKIFTIRDGWSVVAWNDFVSPIKIPEFARSFGLTKNGMHLFFLHCFLIHLAYYYIFYFILLILVYILHCGYQRC
jgi:hypothetical protein